MKNFTLCLSLIFLNSLFGVVKATTCPTGSLSFTSGGYRYAMPGITVSDYTGSFNVNSEEQYYYTLERSGNFTTQNLLFSYNGYGTSYYWYPGSNNQMSCNYTGSFGIVSGTIPANATCGQQETIIFHFKRYSDGCDVCSYTYYIRVPSQSISGLTNICSATNYSILSPVTLGGIFHWTLTNGWTFSQTGTSTYNGSLTTLTVIPPTGVSSTTTLNISGGNLCQSISKSITTNLAQPSWNSTYSTVCIDEAPVTWSVKPLSCATSYTWSYSVIDGEPDGVVLQPNGTSCSIYGGEIGFYSIKVVANNSYSTSPQISRNIQVRVNDPIHCGGKKLSNSNITEIYPNPASNSVNIIIEAIKDDVYNITIYDMTGKQIYSRNEHFSEGNHSVNIDLKDLSNGIYYVIAGNSDNITNKKLIIAH